MLFVLLLWLLLLLLLISMSLAVWGVYLVPEGKHTLCDDYDVSALSCRMDFLAYFWFGSTSCFADTGASRSTNARNKLLCDDAVHDAVVVAVAVFCLRRCCCWSVPCFVEFSLGKALDSNNIEHCSAF